MKKTYIIPSMEAIELKMNNPMLAGSFTTNSNGDVTSGELINSDATGTSLSRGFDFDEDY